MRSNCWRFAWAEYWRRHAAWCDAGRPKGSEPQITFRPSRSDPRQIMHAKVSRLDPATGTAVNELSFTPIAPADAPLWKFWLRWNFDGRVVEGDLYTDHKD